MKNDIKTLRTRRKDIIMTAVVDMLILITAPMMSVIMYSMILFLISPFLPLILTWFYVQPSRILKLTGGRIGTSIRIAFLIIVVIPLVFSGYTLPYEALFATSEEYAEITTHIGPLTYLTYLVIAPVIFALTFFELFGALLVLGLHSRSGDIKVFRTDHRIPTSKAVMYTLAMAVVTLLIAFGLNAVHEGLMGDFELWISFGWWVLLVVLLLFMLLKESHAPLSRVFRGRK